MRRQEFTRFLPAGPGVILLLAFGVAKSCKSCKSYASRWLRQRKYTRFTGFLPAGPGDILLLAYGVAKSCKSCILLLAYGVAKSCKSCKSYASRWLRRRKFTRLTRFQPAGPGVILLLAYGVAKSCKSCILLLAYGVAKSCKSCKSYASRWMRQRKFTRFTRFQPAGLGVIIYRGLQNSKFKIQNSKIRIQNSQLSQLSAPPDNSGQCPPIPLESPYRLPTVPLPKLHFFAFRREAGFVENLFVLPPFCLLKSVEKFKITAKNLC